MSTTDVSAHGPNGVDDPTTDPRAAWDRLAQETWEVELLISGAVLFGLFQLPGAVDVLLDDFLLRVGGIAEQAALFALVMVKLTLYVLISAFVVHLAARFYWAVLIGLGTVFPEGVYWQGLKIGPMALQDARRRQRSLAESVDRADAVASLVFSVGFAAALVFLVSLVVWALAGLVTLALLWLLPLEGYGLVLLISLVTLWLLSATLILGLDLHHGAEIDPEGRKGRVLRRLTRPAFALLYGAFGPVYLILVSQARRRQRSLRKVHVLVFVIVMTLLGIVLVQEVYIPMGGLAFSSQHHLPDRGGRYEIDPRYYESLRAPDSPVGVALIPGDVIDVAWLRTFLPLDVDRTDRWLDVVCPGLEPLTASGLRKVRRDRIDDPALQKRTLACFEKVLTLEIDGRVMSGAGGATPLRFGRHDGLDRRGLTAYLPLADLDPGEHLLTVRRIALPATGKKTRRPPRVDEIPFRYTP